MQKSAVDARLRVIFVLWCALLMGVTLFAAVVWALSSGLLGTWTPTLAPGLVTNFMSAPVLLMVAGILLRRGEVPRAGDAEAYIQRYQTRILVASSMQEGGGLLGLVLCLLGGMPTWALGVWGLAAAAMIVSRPDRSDLDRLEG